LRAWRDGHAAIATRPAPNLRPLSSGRAVAAEQALVFASMCGQTETVRLLLDDSAKNAAAVHRCGLRRKVAPPVIRGTICA
jgi:hypothetical protein